MRAIVQDQYGSADVLRLGDIAAPEPGAGEILVRVRAAGVDPGVWHLMTGLPYLVRLMGFGLLRPAVRVRGRDVSGTVEAVGTGVTTFRAGDQVFGTCEGAFAELACGRASRFAPKPANLSFEQAAAVPTSALTALQGLREARLKAGQKVLVIGASGGVGTYAVQLAKAAGAQVTGVCSAATADRVRSIGADHVVDYRREDITDGSRRFDVILDTGGRRPLSRLARALEQQGTLVIVGGEGGDRWLGGFQRQLLAPLRSLWTGQRMLGLMPDERQEDLLHLKALIEEGKVMPVVDRSFCLSEAAEAVQYLEQGRARGKVVVKV